MNELLTPSEMALADKLTIDATGSSFALMQQAGQAAFDHIHPSLNGAERIDVYVGPGNNGGDGYVIAELLHDAGVSVTVVELCPELPRSADAEVARKRYNGVVVPFRTEIKKHADVVIDCLLGAGLSRDVTGDFEAAIKAINQCECRIISVDLPSGIDGETGKRRGCAISSSETITFFRKKPGHLLQPGREHCGKVYVLDIGILPDVVETIEPHLYENSPALWMNEYPIVKASGHKFDRGHTIVLSGPISRSGAARLAARAALRTGSGLVTVAATKDVLAAHAAQLSAIMLTEVENPEDFRNVFADPRINTVVIGPGLGRDPNSIEFVVSALEQTVACVIDADAMSVFEDGTDQLFMLIHERAAPVVLTPHDGEFARLFPDLVSCANKVERARQAAARSGAIVVLKGSDTVIADPGGHAVINANAPPWLATAGSGDVLSGAIAGLLAQGTAAFSAGCIAVWLHGASGMVLGPGLTADDLDNGLHSAIKALLIDQSLLAFNGDNIAETKA